MKMIKKIIVKNDIGLIINGIKKIIKYININGNKPKDGLIGGLLSRILKSSLSARLLLRSGLEHDSLAVLRIVLETSVKLLVLYNDYDYFKFFENSHEKTRKRLVAGVMKNSDVIDKKTVSLVSKIEKTLDKSKIKDVNNKYKKYKIDKLATLTTLKSQFAHCYDNFNFAVHADVKSANDNLKIKNNRPKVIYNRRFKDNYIYLNTLLSIILEVYIEISKYYNMPYKRRIKKIKTRDDSWIDKTLSREL